MIGTFVLFPLFGFSINTLSLFGLVLAIGLVVDDAIVVVEAVEHHIENGMNPREATLKAMREVTWPVIGVAFVLAAVFIPTAFLPGITGRLYQQFAVTIAISVILSAFNALTLSPALSALLLRPRKKARGPLGWFFGWFNKIFGRVTNGYVNWSRDRDSKGCDQLRVAGGVCSRRRMVRSKLPSGFLPEEDQGYIYMALQLPDAASLERTDAAAHKIEELLSQTPGVQYTTSIIGFNLVTFVQNTYSAFFFVTLKPWSERTKPEEQYDAIKMRLTKELAGLTEGIAFAFPPPAIPGAGTSGGFSFALEDRSGKDIGFLAQNVDKFVAAARKRPEIGGIIPAFSARRPASLRRCRSRQGPEAGHQPEPGLPDAADIYGRLLRQLLQPLRTHLAGLRRGGRRLSDRCEERAVNFMSAMRTTILCRSTPSPRSKTSPVPEFTLRYNGYRAAQLIGGAAPGYSSAQAMKALEETFRETMPPEMGYDYMGMSFQEKKAQEGVSPVLVFGLSLLFVFLILAALYESWSLPFSVLLGTPIAIFGAFAHALVAAEWKTTSMRKSALSCLSVWPRKTPFSLSNSPRPNTRKANRSSTPRSKARVCACDRS